MPNLTIMGAGAWGTGLAGLYSRVPGYTVSLWSHTPKAIDAIRRTGSNSCYLPGVPLPNTIRLYAGWETLSDATRDADAVCVVVPTQHMRAALTRFVQHVPHATAAPWVLCAKGIEQHTGMFVRDIAAAIAPHHPCGLLSGPNFADDIGRGMPAASVLASTDAALCTRLAAMLTTPTFRIYTSQDCVGVQLGGALKNVVAIACGMAIGYGLGESARASLIPRSIAELTRLGVAMGATPATFAGLSCLGDMVLTCTSPRSRNTALGIRIGQGMALQAALAHSPHVAEGVPTATAVAVLAAAHGVALPLCQAVQHVLTGEQPLAEAITALLTRPLSEE